MFKHTFGFIAACLLIVSGVFSLSITGWMYVYAETWGDCISYLPFVHLFNLAFLGIAQIGAGIWAYIKLP